ncbi:pyocin knob domain-containing protein [Lentilactobacillus buchneri]|uniref:pyocin knob domain-containing protein n=1 Tax=Lentilactobacillus buchneri TaxID=1581 RepID=UPI001782A1C2|nr:pyocin knob domain-containing protein [Lentilactobacillus buchneri]
MQKLGDTIITDLGMDLLSSVNNGDDKITYTKTVLAADDLTQESDVDIQKTTSLTLIQQTTGTTVISRVDDTVNLGATFTNKEVTQDFDFYVIGWYAKGSAVITDERLFAITPSTVKQTMPAGKDGAATAAISPKYASALSRSATVSLNPDQAGTVTPEYVDQKIQQIISEGIVNAGSTLSESDNLDSFITTGYHLIKGSLPLSAPEGFSTNGQIIVYGNKDTTDGVTQVAYDDINGTSYVRSYNPTNNKWSDWDLVITKSQLNAVLPTDIARTGEDNDFKGKNTFETDPVNKNGDSYGLAKDIATKVTDNGDNSIEINKQAITPVRDNGDGSIVVNGKTFVPADDSKVVHSTDMRKPASDVAGIEEVNAKQDKIGYTPADDSKVVHDNHDGTITANGAIIIPANEDVIYRIDGKYTDVNDIPMGWLYLNGWADLSGLSNWGLPKDLYYVHCFKTNFSISTTVQIVYGTQLNNTYVRTMSANAWTTWKLLADDSKVAHLSGANNFDTVPTVNNNPLLLASSLPSDLARTGQAQTFTAAQTFSIAPTITDASTDKGDNQAATMADLKSVENSAWRVANTYEAIKHLFNPEVIYRVDSKNKKIHLYGGGVTGVSSDTNQFKFLDFSDISTNISVDSSTSFIFGGSVYETIKIINGVVYLAIPKNVSNMNLEFEIKGTYSNDDSAHIWGVLNYS